MGRLGTGPLLVGRIGSGVRVSASFPKNAHLVGRLGSGPRLVADRADVLPADRADVLPADRADVLPADRADAGFGDRAFQVAGPTLWNSLPASLCQSDTTVGQFKKLLKTHLFS